MRSFAGCMWLMLLTFILTPVPAHATLDVNPDILGVYFDTAGYIAYTNVPAFTPFTAYLILDAPFGPVDGYECTVTHVGVPSYVLAMDLGVDAVDADPSPDGFAVTAATPYPVVGGVVVLASLQYLLFASGSLDFYVGPGTTQTLPGDLPIVFGNGVPRQCNVSSCDVEVPVASVNGFAPIYPPCSEGPSFQVRTEVTVSVSGATSQTIVAGTRAAATDAYDPDYDMPSPPPAPDNIVTVSFEHADWVVGPRFRTDYRDRWQWEWYTDYRVWPLLVETSVGGDLTFDFGLNWEWGPGELRLHDLQTGALHDIFSATSSPTLTIPDASPGAVTLRYELIMGPMDLPPELTPTSRPLAAGWSMIGLPLTPQVGSTVLSLIDYPAPGTQVVYDYDQGTGYTQLGATTMVHPGTGYWLATSEAYDWTMAGSRDLDGETVPLSAGWNLVGCANWFPGSPAGLRVVQGSTAHTWGAAAQLGLVSPDLQTWNAANGDYAVASELQPWHGYWVNALTDGLSLFFHWENFLAAKESSAPAPVAKNAAAWEANLTLADALGRQGVLTVGRRTEATAGFDPLVDRPLPPPSPAGGPRLSSQRPEWGLAAGAAFARDLQGLADVAPAWIVEAQVTSPGPAMLQWDAAGWPAGVDAELYLPAAGQVVVPSLRAQTSYLLPAATTRLELREKTWVTAVPDVPAAPRLAAWPNPFNPQVTLAFEMSMPGRAEVRIYSVRGELVAVVGAGDYVAGRHQAVWDGRDREGREAPSGAYRARLSVDGQDSGAVVGLSLVR
ncbi:MAG: hypothetical protein IPG61_17400 [bacterium]|nr:hypothetical protein [bacterium]MBK7672904.1 hypothetical protein [bacterium]